MTRSTRHGYSQLRNSSRSIRHVEFLPAPPAPRRWRCDAVLVTANQQVPEPIAAAMKKAGLVWLTWPGHRAFPAWFATVDGTFVVLTGAQDEQPLPGLADAGTVEVVVPAKPALTRLLRWTANVRRLQPGTDEWTEAAQVLRTERLNASGLDDQLDRWATDGELLVLEPTGEVSEQPGRYDESPYTAPVETPATTQGRRPATIHRRSRRHPKLSG
jgi:hypothetical protein